jgi:hypothetical protein
MRRDALAFSKQDPTSPNNTILSFIESLRTSNSSHRKYFQSQSGCTRSVGLTYGTNESSSSDGKKAEILMTKRFQHHLLYLKDKFSKVMMLEGSEHSKTNDVEPKELDRQCDSESNCFCYDSFRVVKTIK